MALSWLFSLLLLLLLGGLDFARSNPDSAAVTAIASFRWTVRTKRKTGRNQQRQGKQHGRSGQTRDTAINHDGYDRNVVIVDSIRNYNSNGRVGCPVEFTNDCRCDASRCHIDVRSLSTDEGSNVQQVIIVVFFLDIGTIQESGRHTGSGWE